MFRFSEIIAGQPRSGKTFRACQTAKKYLAARRGGVMVYNNFNLNDFEGATTLVLLADKKEIRTPLGNKKIIDCLYFRDKKGKYIEFNYYNICAEHGAFFFIKITKIANKNLYLNTILSIKNTLHIIDDASNIYDNGRTNEATTTILSSLTHYQIDILFLFHNVNIVPPRFYNYATHVTLFKTKVKCDTKKMELVEIVDIIDDAVDYLNSPKTKQFSSITIINDENHSKQKETVVIINKV